MGLSSCSINEIIFSISAAFSVSDSLLHVHKLFLLPQRVHITFIIAGCDKPEVTRRFLCSLHICTILMSPDEVVRGRDGCRHSVAEGTVHVLKPLLQ